MIRALIAKDLRLVARDRTFRVVLVGYVFIFLAAAIAFFSSFLSESILNAGALLWSRISAAQWILPAGLAPWLILRMHGQEIGDRTVPAIASMIAPPWQMLCAKVISSALYLIVLLSLSFPVLALARLVGAVSLGQASWLMADIFLFLGVVVLLVLHVRLHFSSWAASWIFSYAAPALLGFALYEMWPAEHGSATLVLLLMVALLLALLLIHGSRKLIYERN